MSKTGWFPFFGRTVEDSIKAIQRSNPTCMGFDTPQDIGMIIFIEGYPNNPIKIIRAMTQEEFIAADPLDSSNGVITGFYYYEVSLD